MTCLRKQLQLAVLALAIAGTAAWAQGGHLAAIVDTINNRPEAFYIDTSNHVHVVRFIAGSWINFDITGKLKSPNAAAGSPLSSVVDTIDHKVTTYYIAADNNIHQLAFVAPNWTDTEVTSLAGAPQPAPKSSLSALVDPVDNLVAVFFIGGDQHIHELGFDPVMLDWFDTDLTATARGVTVNPALRNPLVVNSIINGGNGLGPAVNLAVFYVGADSMLHTMGFDGSDFVDANTSAVTGVIIPLSAAGDFNDAHSATQEYMWSFIDLYQDVNLMNIYTYAKTSDPGPYWADLTVDSRGPKAALGSSLAFLQDANVTPNLGEFYYITDDNHIHAITRPFDPDLSFRVADADMTPAGPGAAVGSSLASMVDTTRNMNDVFYISMDQHVHLLSITPGVAPSAGHLPTDRDITPTGPPALP
jgi:hypothetical protein